MNESKKILGKNAILNGFIQLLNLIFPLITFPYVSQVLQVEEFGRFKFAESIIGYFTLIAGFGVSTYSIKQGARYRDKYDDFSLFASQMFIINMISSLISYILLLVSLLCSSYLRQYMVLLLILGTGIFFSSIGMNWVYTVYEEYRYISIRNIAFKIISVLFLFLFVKSSQDTWKYALIMVFSVTGAEVLNLICSRKYWKLVPVKYSSCKTHLKSIVFLFFSNITTTIYVHSDISMLGVMKNDFVVGVYSVSARIYNIVKCLIAAILVVSISRISFFYGEGNIVKFKKTIQWVWDSVSCILLPAMVGIYVLSDEIVILISGNNYLRSGQSLKLLSIALLFALYGWIFNQCILLPAQKEKIILIATCVSAAVNVILNYIFIPAFEENATAFSTIAAELIMMLTCGFYARRVCKINILNIKCVLIILECILILIICHWVSGLGLKNGTKVFLCVGISILTYGIIMLLAYQIIKNKIWEDIV